jgi:hypothetical protein
LVVFLDYALGEPPPFNDALSNGILNGDLNEGLNGMEKIGKAVRPFIIITDFSNKVNRSGQDQSGQGIDIQPYTLFYNIFVQNATIIYNLADNGSVIER